MLVLDDLGAYRENNCIEAKAATSGLLKSLRGTYSAFANTFGDIILLGAEEDSNGSLHAVGVKDAVRILDDFWNTANNPQKVSANVLSNDGVSVIDVDGLQVIRIDVPRANRRIKPVYLNDNPKRSFRRNHSGDYLCRYEEVQSMMRDAADRSQDSKPLSDVELGELNAGTVASYRRCYRRGHERRPWNDLDDVEFLRCTPQARVFSCLVRIGTLARCTRITSSITVSRYRRHRAGRIAWCRREATGSATCTTSISASTTS